MLHYQKPIAGFTIVELIVVIVVIGILAGLVAVAYTQSSNTAIETSMKSDLKFAATKLEDDRRLNNGYPADASALATSEGNTFDYELTSYGYCLAITNDRLDVEFYVDSRDIQHLNVGACP